MVGGGDCLVEVETGEDNATLDFWFALACVTQSWPRCLVPISVSLIQP